MSEDATYQSAEATDGEDNKDAFAASDKFTTASEAAMAPAAATAATQGHFPEDYPPVAASGPVTGPSSYVTGGEYEAIHEGKAAQVPPEED